MKNTEIKAVVDKVASNLSMQGFVLTRELQLRNSKLNRKILYSTADELREHIATLLFAAAQIEKNESIK